MTAPSSSGSSSDQSLLPLFLFALTAKLYIDHHNRQKQQRQAVTMTTETRGEDDASYHHHDTDDSPNLCHQEEQQQQRRLLMRHLRLSIDSPDFSEHHFYESTNHRSIVREGLLPCLPSIHDNDNDSNDDDGEVLLKDCPRWRKLMQRVSIADSVLTRVRKKRVLFVFAWNECVDFCVFLQKDCAALAKTHHMVSKQ